MKNKALEKISLNTEHNLRELREKTFVTHSPYHFTVILNGITVIYRGIGASHNIYDSNEKIRFVERESEEDIIEIDVIDIKSLEVELTEKNNQFINAYNLNFV